MANGPGTPIGFALEARERARKQIAGVSTPGNPQGPKAPKPIAPVTPAPEKKGNSRGDRNNNPGNLEASPWTRKQPGFVRSDGRFAIFDTHENGIRAQETLLRSNYFGKSGTTTVDALISRYGNDPGTKDDVSVSNYKKYVAAKLGVGVGDPITKDKVRQLAQAMREFETGNRSGGGGNQQMAGNKVPQINVQGSSVPGPSGRPNTGVNNQSNRIMNSGGTIESQQRAVESKAANAGAVLDNYLGVLGETQAAKVAETQKFVESARGINQEMTNATKDLQRRVQPIFAARQRVLDQAAAIQEMSPIARSIRGFFDLNYSEDYLMSTSQKLGAIVNENAQMYSVMQGLHADAIEQNDRLMQINTTLPRLNQELAGELVKGAEMQLQMATTNLGITMEGVQNEVQMISAQNTARNDILSRIDGPTATALLGQAEQNGGVVSFNGVELSGQELRERGMQIEGYDIANKNARMALAAGEADLADKNAARMLDYMTDAQVEAAIANGGVQDGVQIAPGLLTEEKNKRVARAVQAAEADAFVATPMAAAKEAMQSAQLNEQIMRKADSIFGPGAVADESIAFSTQITELSTKLQEMQRRGASGAEMGVIRAQLQQARKGFQDSVLAKVTRLVGNDTTGAAYVTSYLMGDQPTPGASADMMVHFAMRGGLPAAMESSALGQNAMASVMSTIESVQNELGPNGARRFGDPVKAAREAARRLANPKTPEGAALRSATTGLRYQSTFSNLPSLAKSREGTPLHPFGKIESSAFAQASRRADSDGYGEIAMELGIKPAQLVALQSGKTVEGIDAKVAAQAASPTTSARIAAAQQRALVTQLDQMPRVSPNMSNGAVLLDFLESPTAQRQIISVDGLTQNGGIGDWMAGNASRGGLLSEFSGYTQGLRAAVDESEQEVRGQAARLARGYRNDPIRRTATILTSAGLNRGDMIALTSAIGPMLPTGTPQQQEALKVGQRMDAGNRAMGTEGYRTDLARMQLQAIDNIILNHKFEDPNLERIRRRAATDWQNHSRAADNMIDALVKPLDRD